MASPIQVRISDTKETDRLLSKMPIELRNNILRRAIRSAGGAVVTEMKRTSPQPGYPGDDPNETPLKETFAVKVITYSSGVVMGIVGSDRKKGGRHLHLVEFGHAMVLWGKRTSGFVEGKPFFRRASDSTLNIQKSRIIETLRRALSRMGRA